MDHTHIVQAGKLHRYADTRESEGVIPELVYFLVRSSIPRAAICRIPYGEEINQPGWDGLVQTDEGFAEFVPAGTSYWEIGTSSSPQRKATEDFEKRTTELPEKTRTEATYVFVTPRASGTGRWTIDQQAEWIQARSDRGWRDIRVIDGVKVADWLREFPAIGRWMAKRIGLTGSLGGLTTPREHWEMVANLPSDHVLPPTLFTVGRDNASRAVQRLFDGPPEVLPLLAEAPSDAKDFLAAYICSVDGDGSRGYGSRCLIVKNEDAWRAVIEARKPHVLLGEPQLGLETPEGMDLAVMAKQKGHGVIVPVSGAFFGDSPQTLRLQSPSRTQIESVLKDAGFPEGRAAELARIGGGRLAAVRRHLAGLGTAPLYATWKNARDLAQAVLIGKWDNSHPADVAAIEEMLGKAYGEWIESLREATLLSDSPLAQQDEKWRVVARGEAWSALGVRLTDEDLNRFQHLASQVLKESDPRLKLPHDERLGASLRGIELKYSDLIREGLAETLALIGSRPSVLTSCSHNKAETTAFVVVRDLLEDAPWQLWATLDRLLPLISEAAPTAFLGGVESALEDLGSSVFHEVFAQEGGDLVGGSNYMSGLLWALEGLAWNPDYLPRVALILSDLAEIDPGGKWANRPANSLVNILLPWHVQTSAPLGRRKAAVESVLREHPNVGWQLLLDLLPRSHGTTTGSHRPVWRQYVPSDWKDGVSRAEYRRQVADYAELAVECARANLERLRELIDRLPDLPQPAHGSLLKHLMSDPVRELSEVDRSILWENLESLVRKHRRFAEAEWALPGEILDKMQGVADSLAPDTPALRYRYLFNDRSYELYDANDDLSQQRAALNARRQKAVRAVLEAEGIDSILPFARETAEPAEVGRALGAEANDQIESQVLPLLLTDDDEVTRQVAWGYVSERYTKLGWTWADAVLSGDWTVHQLARFLVELPFETETWRRVDEHLSEDHEELYWRDARVTPLRDQGEYAVSKLIDFERPGAAIMCLALPRADDGPFNAELATRALLTALELPNAGSRLDQYFVLDLIDRLQRSPAADPDALFKIEWNFLPWLGRYSEGSPVFLERRLASDPAFFGDVIALVFRSKYEKEEEEEVESEPDENRRALAANAYRLLTDWRICPGTSEGSFDPEAFSGWLQEVRRLTEESGHWEIAQIQAGHVLAFAPPDPDGLWIHESIAKALNARDASELRSGYTTGLFNLRGVHYGTGGADEQELAEAYRAKADELDERGFSRFAAAMRSLAASYEQLAEREAH